MADTIDIAFELREDVTVALDALIDAGVELRTPMGDIASHLADTTRERFETSKGPDGVPWKVSKRARKQGGKTLVDRGDLLGSIAESWGDDFAAAGPEASGGAAVYAAIHQLGGTIEHPSGTAYTLDEKRWARFQRNAVATDGMARTGAHAIVIPARPYVGFNDENADYALETLAAHLIASVPAGGAAA